MTHRLWHPPVAFVLLLGCLLFGSAPVFSAPAETGRLSKGTFTYKANNLPLSDVLRDFAGSQGLPMVIADGVTGNVNGDFKVSPVAFLNLMSRFFGLIWYYDGSALYVYPSNQLRSRIFSLQGLTPEAVQAKLATFGLADSRYPLKFERGQRLLVASGPPRHIEMVEAMIAALTEAATPSGPAVVRGFPLKFASAVDRKVQGMVVPGVASTLSAIFVPAHNEEPQESALTRTRDKAVGTSRQQAKRDSVVQNVARSMASGKAMPNVPNPSEDNTALYADTGSGSGSGSGSERSGKSAGIPGPSGMFVADEGTNTVFVRARDADMTVIAQLIAQLDVASDMVEVDATIIDISADVMDSLGFNWQYSSARTSVSLAPVAGANGSSPPIDSVTSAAGFNVSTLLARGGFEFLSRIRALESNGAARIVSQPMVLGAANRTALLSDKQTASVRVAGSYDAQLFSVEAGTTLQVTPRLIIDTARTRIGMDLFIEDGGFSGQTVDGIPIVKRTTIRTDAVLNEGESLLIGGIVVDSTNNSRSGIPGLSRLPWVGALFRTDETTKNQRRRLFLLTPKRVLQNAVKTGATAAGFPGDRPITALQGFSSLMSVPERAALQQSPIAPYGEH